LTGETITLPKSESIDAVEFSFSQAYEWFSQAAAKGHTLAAYNVAIMHFTGLGTYQSCSLANTFIQHVANVGVHTQTMRHAFDLA
jgi:TPR repeat protein